MKKMIFLLICGFTIISCETPYQITETYKTDSLGHTIKTVQKTYSNGSSTTVIPDASVNVVTSPLWWGTPYYTPFYYPRVVVPVRVGVGGGYRGGGRRH